MLFPSPLVNKSVSCWLNSLIQALVSCEPFCARIRQGIKEYGSNPVYRGFFSFIVKNLNGYDTTHCSSEILDSLSRLNRESMSSIKFTQKQQCVLEFLENVLEALKDQTLTELFMSRFIRETRCNHCGHVSKVINKHLFVPMYKNDSAPSNLDPSKYPDIPKMVLEVIGRVETIDSYKCAQCSAESRDVPSVYKICSRPKIFVLAYNKAVDNSEVILVPKFKLNQIPRGTMIEYSCVATVCHYGSPKFGHYVCNCIREDPSSGLPKWYNCNDLEIRDLMRNPLESTDIYLAFYSSDH